MSVVTSSDNNLDLHMPPKWKDWKLIFFAYGKGGIEFYLWE